MKLDASCHMIEADLAIGPVIPSSGPVNISGGVADETSSNHGRAAALQASADLPVPMKLNDSKSAESSASTTAAKSSKSGGGTTSANSSSDKMSDAKSGSGKSGKSKNKKMDKTRSEKERAAKELERREKESRMNFRRKQSIASSW